VEIKPGKRFALFKKKGARSYSARIVMPDSFEEIIDTGTPKMASALATALGRVRWLYRERNIPMPAHQGISEYRLRMRKSLGLPPTATQQEVKAARDAQKTGGRAPSATAIAKALPVVVVKRGRPPGGATADPFADFDARDEHIASKSLLQMAMFFLGDVSDDDRLKNVRAILMRFLQRKTR
jgi:hypothetical protein